MIVGLCQQSANKLESGRVCGTLNRTIEKEVIILPEDTRAEDAAEKVQPEPMPSSELTEPKKPTEGKPGESQESAGKPEEGKKLELPEDARERTKQEFEKLKGQLRNERQRRQQLEQTYGAQRPQQVPAPAQKAVEEFIDPTTGEVDVAGLNKAIGDTQQRAVRAEQTVQGYIEQQQTREAYEAYPQLDSNADDFDKDFHRRTRALIFDSMMNPQDYGNKQLLYKQAADMAHEGTKKAVEKAEAKGAETALEQLTPKEQASLGAEGRSDRRKEATVNLETLKTETRRGKIAATMERLKKIPMSKVKPA